MRSERVAKLEKTKTRMAADDHAEPEKRVEQWAFMSLEITAINPTVKPPGWLRVKSGSAPVAILHPIEARGLSIRVGDALTPGLARRLRDAESRSTTRLEAERLLARRAHSASRLTQLLHAKVPDQVAVAAVVRSLTEAGAIDDGALAAAMAARAVARGESQAHARRAIEQAGIPALVARRAVNGAAAECGHTDGQRAFALIRSHMRPSLSRMPDYVQRRRLAGVLARKGFDDDTIESAMQAALGPAPLRFADESTRE